jgi:hypothetical protein
MIGAGSERGSHGARCGDEGPPGGATYHGFPSWDRTSNGRATHQQLSHHPVVLVLFFLVVGDKS